MISIRGRATAILLLAMGLSVCSLVSVWVGAVAIDGRQLLALVLELLAVHVLLVSLALLLEQLALVVHVLLVLLALVIASISSSLKTDAPLESSISSSLSRPTRRSRARSPLSLAAVPARSVLSWSQCHGTS